MDKYEYRIRAEEINALIDKKEYAEAVKIADTIDWRRVKSVMMLCKISELYKINRRYEDSKEILLLAYDRNPGSRKIVYSLCELAIKLEETVQAVEYYKEFVQIAPRDTGKFILQYRLYEAQDVSLEERIAVLEEYKKRDYREKWAYELAYLYHRIGLATRCVEECDELILWFGEGKYVIKAMELKMLHCPLTASQQEKYDRRFQTEEAVTENDGKEDGENPENKELPIEIKAVDPSQAPTAKIPSKDVDKQLEEEAAKEAEDITEEETEEIEAKEETEEKAEASTEASLSEGEEKEEEIPLTMPDDDLDIKVKTIDVDNEYSTINLQQELAKNLASLMAEEDMGASDATMAMPFATLAEAATSDTIMGAITDDSIKNAIIAPLLQDTKELTPITEEDLLASMEENASIEERASLEENASMKENAFLEENITVEKNIPVGENTSMEQAVEEPVAEPLEEQQENLQNQEAAQILSPVQPVSPQEPAEIRTEQIKKQEEFSKAGEEPDELEEQFAKALQEETKAEEAEHKSTNTEVQQTSQTESQPMSQSEVSEAPLEPEEKQEDGQITGQLSLEDIMAEWEETKKANEERRIQEMRERVIKQTGPMFSNFDAMARASVQADLDLINPVEDVFKHDNIEEQPSRQETDELLQEPEQEEIAEETQAVEMQSEATEKKASSSTFNTEEIFGLEEKLLDVLNSPEIKEAAPPIEPIAIDSSFFEDAEKTVVEKEEPAVVERPIQNPVQPLEWEPATVANGPMQMPTQMPVSEPVETVQTLIPEPVEAVQAPIPEPVEAVQTPIPEPVEAVQAPIPEPVEVVQTPMPEPVEAVQAPIPEPVETVQTSITPESVMENRQQAPEATAASIGSRPQSAAEAVAAMKAKTIVLEKPASSSLIKEEPVIATPSAQEISIGKPVDLKSTDFIQALIPQNEPEARALTKEEKARFAHFAPGKEEQTKVARALDSITLSTTAGNMIITGERGTGTIQAAQNVVVQLKEKYPDFSGKMAKITGVLLAEKDIGATLENLENSALIIEQAGDMPADALGNLLFHLDRLKGHRIFVIMEDIKSEMERLTLLYPDIAAKFNARMDIESLDNDGLVCYAKEYAKEQEYAIDDMGVLALYTKISDMQTNEHSVTVAEVKEMVDKAIVHAGKKNMSHFMDIILAKRYDGDDMIILREKDFLG